MWFCTTRGRLKLSLNTARLKTMNMQARPECSLFILDLADPYRYLEVRAAPGSSPTTTTRSPTRSGAKYGGTDLRKIDQPGQTRVVVTIEPVNVWPVNMHG